LSNNVDASETRITKKAERIHRHQETHHGETITKLAKEQGRPSQVALDLKGLFVFGQNVRHLALLFLNLVEEACLS
jgi:hypothetical protein